MFIHLVFVTYVLEEWETFSDQTYNGDDNVLRLKFSAAVTRRSKSPKKQN